jgi:ssDNA-binding Zn-finger/Zn-ribbon topoisomerase 1
MSLCPVCGKLKKRPGDDPVFLRCSCMVDERFEELTKQINDLYEKINRITP